MAPRISEKAIQEIAARIPILDVVSPCVTLTKAGKNYKGLCPFHPDKNPSFIVNPDRNTFHCFGCGVGGDAYSFFMKFHNVPFLEAVEELSRRAGLHLDRLPAKRDPKKEEALRAALELNQLVCQYYHQNLLKNPKAEGARRYLQQRGVTPDSVSRFLLGYALDAWDGLVHFLTARKGSLSVADTLGLILPRKSGAGFYDRFRNRLMFPILGTTGQVIAFGGRALDDQGPKYLNSPESPLYHKGANLYGLHLAQESVREQDTVLLVEGYLDLIALHEHGFAASVAVLGTALTVDQIQLLKRYTRNFVLLFDGDEAGRRASFRNLPEFLERGIPVKVAYLPEKEDPDSYLRTRGVDSFRSVIEQAAPLLDVFLAQKTGTLGRQDTVSTKLSILREVLPVIGKIPDRLEKNLRISSLAEKVGLEELFLRSELSNLRSHSAERSEQVQTDAEVHAQEPPEERLLCQVLIQYPALIPRFLEAGVLEACHHPGIREALRALATAYQQKGYLDLPEILAAHTDQRFVSLLTALSCREEFTPPEAATALEDSIHRIQRKILQSRLMALSQRIEEAERNQQQELQNRLSLEKQSLLEQEVALLRQSRS